MPNGEGRGVAEFLHNFFYCLTQHGCAVRVRYAGCAYSLPCRKE